MLEGGRFQEASDKNRIRIRPIAAPRGILFDRKGLPLVDNRPAFTLSLIPRELDRDPVKRDATLGRVASLLQIPFAELQDAVTQVSPDSILPVRVRRGLSMEDVARVEEWKLELPGVIVEVEPQRAYPNSRFAAHLLGYVREANDEQLKQGRYRRGDMVGQSGLERLLDEFLRGKDGGERIEVDAMGRQMRMIQSTEPHPGAQVVTTIDRRIQEAAEKAMEGHAGAVVVMDPRNGDVLAMVSTPAFEIDRFTGTIEPQRVAAGDPGSRASAAEPDHPEPVRAGLGVQDRGGGGGAAGRHDHADRPHALHGRVPPRRVDVQGLEGRRARHRRPARRHRASPATSSSTRRG